MAGRIFYILILFIVAVLDAVLLSLMLVFRAQSKACRENFSPYCPIVRCADGSNPTVTDPPQP